MQLAQQGIIMSYLGAPLTVNLTENAASPIDDIVFTVTAVFSREVVDLVAADLSVGNATIGTIYTDDNITWLITVYPDFAGNVTVSIPAGNVAGTAGGVNLVSNTITVTIASDYTTNIWDEWFPQRKAYLNVGGTLVSNWVGQRNAKRFTGNGAAFPVSGEYTLTGSNYFSTSNAVATGWTGDFSIFLRIKNASTLTATTATLFNSTGGTSFRIDAKNASNRIQINVGGVTTAHATQAFIQDSGEHSVGFVVDFGAGTCKYFLDGTLTATINFTGTADMDWTGTFSGALGRLNGTSFFGQTWDKLRIYQEAVSDSNAAVITGASGLFHTFTITDTKQTRVVLFGGQSNMVGSGLLAGDMPAYLQAEMQDIFIWTGVTTGFMTTLAGTRPTNCGPQLAAVYALRLKYPDDNIFYLYKCAANQSLAVNWLSSGVGNLYSDQVGEFSNAIKVLRDVELRNVIDISYCMMQGEEDATDLTMANNYETNLTNWVTDARVDFDEGTVALEKIIWARIHDDLPVGPRPYSNTVRAAVDTVNAGDANVYSIDTDNNTTFPLQGDDVHFDEVGIVALGEAYTALL